jgi:hypothetical protein
MANFPRRTSSTGQLKSIQELTQTKAGEDEPPLDLGTVLLWSPPKETPSRPAPPGRSHSFSMEDLMMYKNVGAVAPLSNKTSIDFRRMPPKLGLSFNTQQRNGVKSLLSVYDEIMADEEAYEEGKCIEEVLLIAEEVLLGWR